MLWSLLGLSLTVQDLLDDKKEKEDSYMQKSILFGLGLSGVLFLGLVHRSAKMTVSDLTLINAASTLRIRNNRIFGKYEFQFPVNSVIFKAGKSIQLCTVGDTFYLKNGTILNEAALQMLLKSRKQ